MAFLSMIVLATAATLPSTSLAEPQLTRDTFGPVDGEQTLLGDVLLEQLDHPWGMAFTDNNQLLITERSGQLRVVDYQLTGGQVTPVSISQPVEGLPDIWTGGQGGLLDVIWHDGVIYFSYAESGGLLTNSTAVMRAELARDGQRYRLTNAKKIFTQTPKYVSRAHFGSRLITQGEHLYITLGERYIPRDDAQTLDNHHGKIVRIHLDGSVPSDNPFANSSALPEIWSLGHRNPQGASLHPASGELWVHEHGPRGGDELNLIHAGSNYGWPVITYGKEYIGGSIGEGTAKPGMEQPKHFWVPSIAPSGMLFLDAGRYPDWQQHDLLIGSLKFRQLVRLTLSNDGVGPDVISEERIPLPGLDERIRDLAQGPDGLVYLLTDEENGKLVRLRPGK